MSMLRLPDRIAKGMRGILPTHKLANAFLLSLLFFTFVIPALSASVQESRKTFGSLGTISGSSGHIPANLILIYSSDFESVTRKATDRLNIGKDAKNRVMDQYFSTDGNPSEINWIEPSERNTGVTAHSGTRSIGMSTGGSGSGQRNEFNIVLPEHFGGDLYGKEMYISVWLYFPPSWSLPSESWTSFANPFQATTYPYTPVVELHMNDYRSQGGGIPSNPSGALYVTAAYGTPVIYYLGYKMEYHPPFGSWWKLEEYVYFHPTAGKVKIWLDGNVLADSSNVQTINSSGQSMLSTIAKVYHEGSSQLFQLWVDDLEIYGSP